MICFRKLGIAILFTLAASFSLIQAQTTTGRISGTVTDSAGAVIAGANVTVTNPATNISQTATADENGFYTVTNLPVGTYTVSVEMPNFKKSVKTEIVLNADARLTIDFGLEAGQVSEVVQVVDESGEKVNTTSGEVAKVIDNQQISNLALNGRNYYQLLSIIPGAVVTADDALDTNLATNTININGNRGVANNLTVDGGNNNNAGSNASQINNVGVDFIQEVKIQTSNYSAEYGRNSGAQVNVITKRGSNKYHGTGFEFLRNDALDARDAFAATRPFLRYHNYGYSFGGALPFFNFGEGGPMFKSGKDKFFFFLGQEWKSIHRFAASSTQTLPTTAELNGDFSFRLRGADGVVGTADDGFIKDPLKTGTCSATNRTACFTGNIIPTARITPDGAAIANVYRTMAKLATRYVDSPVGSNATFQPPITSDFRQEFIRLDYIFNGSHSIFGRYVHDNNSVVDPYGTFINSPLPTSTQLRNRPGNGLQLGYIWNIKATLINEAKYNAAWTDQRIVPSTPYWNRATYNYTFAQVYPNGGLYETSIPNTSVSGFASFSGVAASLTALAHDKMVSDTLTWVNGNHTMKFGGLYNFSEIYQNGRSLYAGNVSFSTGSNTNTTGNALADALLGNFRTYSEAQYDPAGHFRFQQYEAFVNDDWRINRRLSIQLGLRYLYGTPFYAAENNITNFDPALYDPSKAVVLTSNGAVVTIPAGANRYNGLVREGDVPSQYQSVIPSATSAAVLSVPATAPRGFYDARSHFMPRFGFAYSPFDDAKTAIRGGFGMFYDRIEGNIIFPLENNPPFVDSASFENGNLASITGGTTSALAPFGAITTIDPDMQDSYTMNFSLGVQRELPWGLFVEVNGIGNLGRHLTRQVDINGVPFAIQAANPTTALALLRPYKGFSAINQRKSDATSHYYGLQLYGAKRKGDVLATISYTLGKAMADANVLTEAAEEGLANREFNYGPATFDRRHVFVATYTYRLPFFRKSNGFLKNALGGFELSGITRMQSGRPLTITGSSPTGTANSTRRADLVSGVDIYLKDNRNWLNPAAFTAAPANRLGNSPVGVARGPWLMTTDFAVRKRFQLTEKLRLRIEGNFFNVFNRNNFSGIQTTITNASFGTFTSSGPGRSIQLGAKLEF